MRLKWLVSLGLVVCLVMAFALPMCAPAPAPPVEEEKPPVEEELASSIKAYMCSSPENNARQAEFVREHIGVTVKQHFTSCGECHAKLMAETPHFAADMVFSCCGPQAFTGKKEGWSLPYDSPVWEGTSEEWKDPDNNWFCTDGTTFVLVGNPDLLAAAGYTLPESWDDLLDPKWKGQIVMPSPATSGTAFRMLYSFITLYGFNADKGEEGGWEYMEKLDKNMHHYTRGGNDPTTLVSEGEFMLGITHIGNVKARMDEGYPMEWTIPKEGSGRDISISFILKGTKEIYTCQKIIDLIGSVEYAKLRASMGYIGRLPEAPSALFGGMPKFIPNIDLTWAYDNKERLCNEWAERILRA